MMENENPKINENYDPISNTELTKREIVILKLIAKGFNNFEIADVIHISYHTVKVHVSAILRKFNVKTRTQAVICAITRGYL